MGIGSLTTQSSATQVGEWMRSTSTFGSALMVASKMGIRIVCVGMWCWATVYGDCDRHSFMSISSLRFDSIRSHGDNVRESSSSISGGLWCIRDIVWTISISSCSMGEHITTCVWLTAGTAMSSTSKGKRKQKYFKFCDSISVVI